MNKDNKNPEPDNTDKKLHISDVSKRSQIQSEISYLLYQVNSRYGAKGEYPTDKERIMMYAKISELREQLKNL